MPWRAQEHLDPVWSLPYRESDFVNWFRQNFVNAHIRLRSPQLMSLLLASSTTGTLLQSSLVAISIMHFGSTSRNLSVVQAAQRHYIQTLRQLQAALNSSSLSKTEDVLACANVLGMYEVCFGKILLAMVSNSCRYCMKNGLHQDKHILLALRLSCCIKECKLCRTRSRG